MNKRIEKVREDIRLTEKKIRELSEYLKTLKVKEKQLCDDEILKTMRQMAGRGGDVMELLRQLKDGAEPETDEEENQSEKHMTSKTQIMSDGEDFSSDNEEEDHEEE